MEPTTCVVDAATLIEHIHEIKSWTYDGYLNIVLPLCTIERVEQLYKIKKEQQDAKVLDPPKKRLSWKNVRKEHPAFDINLQVALEFVKRMEIEEPNTSFTFQKASEEYSPWKGVEVQQEKTEVKEDNRPSTFAQALAKSNTPSGLFGIANVPKGPVKPKLVAKASGIDLSPWKMNKKAPRVSPSEVPEALRPLLSYTLWRIYENVATWSDSNPTVLLSNDSKTSATAHKLNITTKKIEQLRQTIAARKLNETDGKTSGDLERDFGFSELEIFPLENGTVDEEIENLLSQVKEDSELTKPDGPDKTLNGDHADPEKSEDASTGVMNEGLDRQATEFKTIDDIQGIQNVHLGVDQGEQKEVHNALNQVIGIPESDILKEPVRISNKSESAVTEDEKLEFSRKPAWITSEVNLISKTTDICAKGTIHDEVAAELDALPASSFLTKLENTSARNECSSPSTLAPLGKHSGFFYENYSETSQPESSSRPATVSGSSSSSRQSSHESSSLPTHVPQEPEDSDEEVVVFNPRAKRFSAQQKPVSKTVPIISDAPKTGLAAVSTTTSVAAFETGSTAVSITATSPKLASAIETSPKLASVKANSPKLSSARTNSYRPASARNNHAKPSAGRNSRPQTPNAPAAVIDPDFFGRNSVVNVRSSIQNGYSRPSPRGSPRRGPRIPDSDVDYVLTSGATREAARGKGKLWVP